jgi:probable rRNA maturation factor
MILNRQRRIAIRLAPLDRFLERVRQELRLPADAVSVCLLSDATMARLNRSFRGRRGTTDVLSFPANGFGREPGVARNPRVGGDRNGRRMPSSPASSTSAFLGDIAISPATARSNAHRFGRSLPDELRVLILHGVLHLLGYDHETDRGEMDRRERRLRRQLGLR